MDPATLKLCADIDQLLGGYTKWEEPLRQYQADNFPRVNKDGYTWEKFERGLGELEAALKAEHDPHPEFYRLLERLCASYLASSSAGRAEIRSFVAARKK